MMKISSMFLRILLFILIMEEVLTYRCYEISWYMIGGCLQKKDKWKIIECWQNLSSTFVDVLPTEDCITASFIVEDDTKLVWSGKYNTSSAQDFCKNDTSAMKKYLEDQFGIKVKDSKCTHCHESYCNEDEIRNGKLRCYATYTNPCNQKFIDEITRQKPGENASEIDARQRAGEYALISCIGAAEIKQKEECKLCASLIYTTHNNTKFGQAICTTEKECGNDTYSNKEYAAKSIICIPCKYDLCNNLEKQGLRKNEARNQLLSNPTVIILFILSLLVCLMF